MGLSPLRDGQRILSSACRMSLTPTERQHLVSLRGIEYPAVHPIDGRRTTPGRHNQLPRTGRELYNARLMDEFLSQPVQEQLRREIGDAGGNEVFCIGHTDAGQLVIDLEVLARGSRDAVPAILQSCRPGDVVIHNHPSGHLEPSEPDLAIAGSLGSLAVGFYIVDNQVETALPGGRGFRAD